MHIDSSLLTPIALLVGALIGGGASLAVARYNQRCQERLQRIAHEVAKREAVYAEFVMNASNLLLTAHVRNQDEMALHGDEQRLLGLINRMRLFAPADVVSGAEAVLREIIEVSLQPGVDLRQLAREVLSGQPGPDPFPAFSRVCRRDLDGIRRTME